MLGGGGGQWRADLEDAATKILGLPWWAWQVCRCRQGVSDYVKRAKERTGGESRGVRRRGRGLGGGGLADQCPAVLCSGGLLITRRHGEAPRSDGAETSMRAAVSNKGVRQAASSVILCWSTHTHTHTASSGAQVTFLHRLSGPKPLGREATSRAGRRGVGENQEHG